VCPRVPLRRMLALDGQLRPGSAMTKRRSPRRHTPADSDTPSATTPKQHRDPAQRMEEVVKLPSVLAHDFSNLLTTILGHCDLLLLSLPQEDPTRKTIEEIRNAGRRAEALTRQLLAYTRDKS